ncbi:MAG TPA: hypothetical protein VJC21_04310 [Candidatus Nanoarchaeia archaeon]|nr:hypothetical protein [Candidatus Nanoarchaeia archaeon]
MNCPMCRKKTMEQKKGFMEEDGIEFEAYRCTACGEEMMTMKQLKGLATQYRKMRTAKEVTFAKWGNSLAVRIPHNIAYDLKLSAGKSAMLLRDKAGIKIIPKKTS